MHIRTTTERHPPSGARAALRALFLVAGACLAATLAACGSSVGGSSSSGNGSGGGSGGTGTYALSLQMVAVGTNAALNPPNQLGPPSTANVVATLTQNGSPVSNQLVNLYLNSGTPALATVTNPLNGMLPTDSNGQAVFTIGTTGAGGGGMSVSAQATVGTTIVTQSLVASVGQVQSASLQVSCLEVGSTLPCTATPTASMTAYSTAVLSAAVAPGSGSASSLPSTATVSFTVDTSQCASGGTVTISPTSVVAALTNGSGTAQTTIIDNGCSKSGSAVVPVSASVGGVGSQTDSLTVKAPTTGSIKFVSASPNNTSIVLAGQGGAGRQTYATLTYQLVDQSGASVPNYPVCFDATTYSGGLTVDGKNNQPQNWPQGVTIDTSSGLVTAPASVVSQCGSDNTLGYIKNTDSSGNVAVQVNSGVTPTPVRIRARAAYPTISSTPLLETLSNQLVISTGLPVDKGMDLVVDTANIEGRSISGQVANLTVRLSDLFGNPVADGTQVNFITSGGAVCTSTSGGCTTVNGACSCTLVSADRRPLDGRVVVMAYAIGLPDFIDQNNNFQFTNPADPSAPNHTAGLLTDTFDQLQNAYLDSAKLGYFDTNGGAGYNLDVDQCLPYVFGTQCSAPASPAALCDPTYNGSGALSNGGGGASDGSTGNTLCWRQNLSPSDARRLAAPQVSTGWGPTYLRRSGIIYFSGSSNDRPSVILPATTNITFPGAAAGAQCPSPSPTATLGFALTDGYGNPMPAGTVISMLTTTNLSAAPVAGEDHVAAFGLRTPSPTIDNNRTDPLGSTYTLTNLPKTSTYVGFTSGLPVDPTLVYTVHGLIVTASTQSCLSGSAGAVQVVVASPLSAGKPACIYYEGETMGTCPRTSIPVHYQ